MGSERYYRGLATGSAPEIPLVCPVNKFSPLNEAMKKICQEPEGLKKTQKIMDRRRI